VSSNKSGGRLASTSATIAALFEIRKCLGGGSFLGDAASLFLDKLDIITS
jgi:hypothetical protein